MEDKRQRGSEEGAGTRYTLPGTAPSSLLPQNWPCLPKFPHFPIAPSGGDAQVFSTWPLRDISGPNDNVIGIGQRELTIKLLWNEYGNRGGKEFIFQM
jgi:hypothetical protein